MRIPATAGLALAALTGCAGTSSYVHSDAALGRVVVYRNGVAYFERTAHIEGDSLRLAVPGDKVDDFLKSLTVIDEKTKEPAPIAYPTAAQTSSDGLIDMKITLTGPTSHDLRLSYVTEAPSWKPSYRIVLGKDGKVNVQASAIVDNTSGEDWQDVQLGVGSSSALSFRFDLRSVRNVRRETLRQDDLFAQAPPMGGAAYGQQPQKVVTTPTVVDVSDDALLAGARGKTSEEVVVRAESLSVAPGVSRRAPQGLPLKAHVVGGSAPTVDVGSSSTGVTLSDFMAKKSAEKEKPPAPPPQQQQAAANPLEAMARTIQGSSKTYVVEGYADKNDADKHAASLDRANRAREQLLRYGVAPDRVVAVGGGEKAGKNGGVSIAEATGDNLDQKPKTEVQLPAQAVGSDPIGTSHFESKARMTVPRGSSAMVSILSTDTEGEVVYFYDAEGPRGNAAYPFRAVRIRNPTDSVLESGPVTVFGEGKFIGEGMSEPIPARSIAFIPFALDRQVVVETQGKTDDVISRILTVQRGVFSTEVEHIKRTTLALVNRSGERATVYVKHVVAEGYKLTKAPEKRDRLGTAYLFRVDVEPGGKSELVLEEATPLFKSTDIRSPAGMEQVSAYLSSAAVEGPLKASVAELLKLHKEMANTEQQIQTMREAMSEYRARMDELHAQVVTLRAVKTAGPLMQNLEKKLAEVSDKLSRATIDLVALQEKLMVARIKFQDGVADLSFEKKG